MVTLPDVNLTTQREFLLQVETTLNKGTDYTSFFSVIYKKKCCEKNYLKIPKKIVVLHVYIVENIVISTTLACTSLG